MKFILMDYVNEAGWSRLGLPEGIGGVPAPAPLVWAIGEMLVADAARRTGRPYVSVRFGNVLGSTGSVVPIFKEQLDVAEAQVLQETAAEIEVRVVRRPSYAEASERALLKEFRPWT